MADKSRPGEFQLIAELFAPLAAGHEGAYGLLDDAATIAPASGCRLVVTTDMMVAGRHFRAGDSGRDVARRLLRVNLSDLAAMGARPRAYLLALALSEGNSIEWIRDFAAGLGEDQKAFGVDLIGGDTTATEGPFTASITALGEVPDTTLLRRGTASADELVYVSGTIGDAALGLMVANESLRPARPEDGAALVARFQLPLPRIALGQALGGLATACADVSDGLVADLGHICIASGIGAEIDAGAVPLSPAVRAVLDADPALLSTILTGGDDYELVFTVPPERAKDLDAAAERAGTPVTYIGRTRPGKGVRVLDGNGTEIPLDRTGYKHF